MTITHHPGDEILAAFASGTLDEARSVVVAAHVSLCAHCRATVATFEQFAGALVERASPAALRPGALDAALSRIDADAPAAPVAWEAEPDCPLVLAPYPVGKWRWIGPGLYWRGADVPSGDGTRVFMLKAAAGSSMPHHGHSGIEWTCVLQGAFRHDLGRYGPGDFDEADDSVDHTPFVEEGDPCICLVAMQGNLQLRGLVGRLLQPFVRL
ncbi:anti-sigma factor, putative, ChrR family [Bradyrhizobium sp. YR681]|uniref:ChrR family anti-sigma-E factor n=1 Tax=Bradyrhizobium sp. YR681 TaxID=1144344 RepID=UPI0002711C0D|nr:ChrR family anti-sigma-E factor [Bradyrhizobium sp. YR681]EJN12334.1 anti-sigma factor, putative, ChrR family [Bradyrhizobium sp. YR681]